MELLGLYVSGIVGCYGALAIGSLLFPRLQMSHTQRFLAALMWPGTIIYLIKDGPNELQ